MTHEEIIAIAREADPFGDDGRLVSLAMLTPKTLERFAALVAAREREACALVADATFRGKPGQSVNLAVADAIRARGTP